MKTQDLVDYARCYSDCASLLGVAGYSVEPAVTLASEVLQYIRGDFHKVESLSESLPIPSKFEHLVKQGFLSLCQDKVGHKEPSLVFTSPYHKWQSSVRDQIVKDWQDSLK